MTTRWLRRLLPWRAAGLLSPWGSRRFSVVIAMLPSPYVLFASTQSDQERFNLLFEITGGGNGMLVQAFLLHSRCSLQKLQHGSQLLDRFIGPLLVGRHAPFHVQRKLNCFFRCAFIQQVVKLRGPIP